jgi:hypothetical protein
MSQVVDLGEDTRVGLVCRVLDRPRDGGRSRVLLILF